MSVVMGQGGGGGGGQDPDDAMSGHRIQKYFEGERFRAESNRLEQDSRYRQAVAEQLADEMDADEYYNFMERIYRPSHPAGMSWGAFRNAFAPNYYGPREPSVGRISEALKQRRRYRISTLPAERMGLSREAQDLFRPKQGFPFPDTGLRGKFITSSIQRGSGLRSIFYPDFQDAMDKINRMNNFNSRIVPYLTAQQRLAVAKGGMGNRLGSDSFLSQLNNDQLQQIGQLIQEYNRNRLRENRRETGRALNRTLRESKKREKDNQDK